LNISIADINFRLSCAEMPLLPGPFNQIFSSFNPDSCPPAAGTVDIDVKIDIKDIPTEVESTKIFEAPETWSLFKHNDEYCWLHATGASDDRPSCCANFKRRPDSVSVNCGEQLLTTANGEKGIINPISYPLDQILLMYALAEREGALVHASAVEINGKAYMFPGKSGAGKSTISRLFADRGRELLSDDRIVTRKIDDSFYAFGTPWPGDAGIAVNRKLPLAGIFFILKGDENRIEKISPSRAAENMMPVTSIPWYDETAMNSILDFLGRMVSDLPACNLYFKPDTSVVDYFEEFISQQ